MRLCVDCNKELGYGHKNLRCRSCSMKFQVLTGIRKKVPKRYCKECGKEINKYHKSLRCRKCANFKVNNERIRIKKQYYCKLCNKEITRNSKSGMCGSCSCKEKLKNKRNHPMFGKKFDYKPRPKMKGKPAWNKGNKKIKYCIECNKILGDLRSTRCKSCNRKNITLSDETKKKICKTMKKKIKEGTYTGYTFKKGNSISKGIVRSEEYKNKMSLVKKGYKHTDEAKEKMSNSKKGTLLLDKNPNWQGGKSFEPYNIDWTNSLRRSIRERDNYLCRICKNKGSCVHHIDYNKKNCNTDNLITLCRKCHVKTNFKRDFWITYFSKL